jgi:phosphatidylserine/phosphatidylglycerophosphate/cardiolipin synthase-like enzyme
MHQKAFLADNDLASVGSINLDYRSFMLNFELAAVVQDKNFASEVEAMFLADFDRSRPENLRAFDDGYPKNKALASISTKLNQQGQLAEAISLMRSFMLY